MTDIAITNLILETFRLNGRLLSVGDALVSDLGLTSARWQVLGAIALSPVPLPVAYLARNMGLSRQAVQRLSNDMVDEGLVQFSDNPHHRRAKLVIFTPEGRKAYKAAIARQQPWARKLKAGLSTSQIEAATAVLRHLRRKLEDEPKSSGDLRLGTSSGGRNRRPGTA